MSYCFDVEFYDMFKSQIIASNETMRISNFLASYCAADKEVQAFVAKVVQEKEKKLKEFNFKLLHGIMPCNKIFFDGKLDHMIFVTYVRKYKLLNICYTIVLM